MEPVSIIIGVVVGCVIGALLGFVLRKKIAEGKIGSAEQEAKRIVDDAKKTAETKKK